MVHDCVICGLSFEGELGDLLGMKYTCDLSMVSDHFERIELPSSSTLYDRLLGRPPAPTTFYRIVACWTCRYDLSNGIRHWLAGRYNVMPWDHRPDVGDCPICGAADQDGRTLQAVRLPAPPPLLRRARRHYGVLQLSTCGSCRGDFLRLLGFWLVGDLIRDGRVVRDDVWDHLRSWFDVEAKHLKRESVRASAPQSFFRNTNRPLAPTALRTAR